MEPEVDESETEQSHLHCPQCHQTLWEGGEDYLYCRKCKIRIDMGGRMDEPILDANDQALVGHFLRGMTRFEKFVRAQGSTHVAERIIWAHSQALLKFLKQQELMIGLDDLNLDTEETTDG